MKIFHLEVFKIRVHESTGTTIIPNEPEILSKNQVESRKRNLESMEVHFKATALFARNYSLHLCAFVSNYGIDLCFLSVFYLSIERIRKTIGFFSWKFHV